MTLTPEELAAIEARSRDYIEGQAEYDVAALIARIRELEKESMVRLSIEPDYPEAPPVLMRDWEKSIPLHPRKWRILAEVRYPHHPAQKFVGAIADTITTVVGPTEDIVRAQLEPLLDGRWRQ